MQFFAIFHSYQIDHIDASHNIYDIPGRLVNKVEEKIVIKMVDGRRVITKGVVDRYTYTYESTAAHGGTIFWKYGRDYLRVTKAREYK